MITSSKDLSLVPRKWLLSLFVMLCLSLALNLIVAVGNWHLYARVKKLEANRGLQAMPQSQQKP